MPTLFNIELDRIKLRENGVVDKDAKGVNALGAILFYPREGTPAVNAARAMKLVDNEGLLFTSEPYQNRLLFKESVRDRTVLTIEVSAIDKPSRIDQVFSKLIGVALTTAAGGVGGAILSAVAKAASGSIFETIGPKKKVDVIARGTLEFDESFAGGKITIPLKVPKNLTFFDMKLGPNGKPTRTKKALKKGDSNGKVVIDIRKL